MLISRFCSVFALILICKFLNYDYLLSLRDIFENNFYKELSLSSFKSNLEDEIMSLNFFFTNRKYLIEATNIKKTEKKKMHDSHKKISTANLFIRDLITFSASANLENISAKKKRSREICIILNRNCRNRKNEFI